MKSWRCPSQVPIAGTMTSTLGEIEIGMDETINDDRADGAEEG